MSASCTRDEQPAEIRDGAAAVSQGVHGRVGKALGGFQRDQSGAVAMMFGIMLIPLNADGSLGALESELVAKVFDLHVTSISQTV